MDTKDTVLPLEFESFKGDLKVLFSISIDKLELIFNELEKKGVRFSESDIGKVAEIDKRSSITVRRLLTYIIPKTRENPEIIKNELQSLGLDRQKLDLVTERILVLKEETSQACEIIFNLHEFLDDQSHIGEIKSDLNFATISSSKGRPVMLLPTVKMIIMTHPGYSDVPEQISVNLEPKQLQELIDNLQGLLSRVHANTREIKNLLGNKAIITLGDD